MAQIAAKGICWSSLEGILLILFAIVYNLGVHLSTWASGQQYAFVYGVTQLNTGLHLLRQAYFCLFHRRLYCGQSCLHTALHLFFYVVS